MVTVFRHLLNLSQGQSVGQGQEKVKSQIFIKSSLNQGSTVRVIEIFWVRGPPRSAISKIALVRFRSGPRIPTMNKKNRIQTIWLFLP